MTVLSPQSPKAHNTALGFLLIFECFFKIRAAVCDDLKSARAREKKENAIWGSEVEL